MSRRTVVNVVATAFMLGAFLFGFLGLATAPKDGMADLGAALAGFIVGGPLLATMAFATLQLRSRRPLRERAAAVVAVAGAAAAGGAVVLGSMVLATRLDVALFTYLGLPAGAAIVAFIARAATKEPSQ